MNKSIATLFVAAGLVLGSGVALAAPDTDADRDHPKAFVKDSAITTKIKTKLGAEHLTSLARIHVDTDNDGVVWLTGSARTQDAIDKAEAIARETDGVKSVRNQIKVRKDG